MAATKRKRSSVDASKALTNGHEPALKRRTSARTSTTAAAVAVNPDLNGDVIDAPDATRASPDSDVNDTVIPGQIKQENGARSESPLSDAPDVVKAPTAKKASGKKSRAAKNVLESEKVVSAVVDAAANNAAPAKKARGKVKIKQEEGASTAPAEAPKTAPAKKSKDEDTYDPEADGNEEADPEEVKEALSRPPPVHSDYLPLPWKGRLGYACLNTYLRNSNPPVFTSRTCRIQSILEHRHPLSDPSQPEHPTKNRPDRTKPADIEFGNRYVESLCIANIKDIAKMGRWNDRYNIKFFRLSSEMFPFASHPEYGYKLAPFASEALAEAGKVIAHYGHRVTTHPGQFTQLGSPRKQVIDNAIRDLAYHDELLSLLKLPHQMDKDAVMILHMGGIFDGKEGVLQRFREHYKDLPQSVKNRLVLENDDMGWSVHDLLPICEELNIPMVLDYHHHNIVFDPNQIREGTKDIMDLYPRITATWTRKGIKQKMHYSEPTPPAITPSQRRKHNPRVATLPPCPPDMDLMIEAKDKEQAVFELMRTFKLPGYDTFNDVVPYTRNDDNKFALAQLGKKKSKQEEAEPELVPDDEIGMGGPEGRVYWPPGMEEWLRPKKREVKKKDAGEKTKEQIKKEATEAYNAREAKLRAEAAVGDDDEAAEESEPDMTPATKKARAAMKKKERSDKIKAVAKAEADEAKRMAKEEAAATKGKRGRAKKQEQAVPTPDPSDEAEEELQLDDEDDEEAPTTPALKRSRGRKTGGRQAKSKRVSYAEEDDEDMVEA